MNSTKKISALALATIVIAAPATMELNCSNGAIERPVDCGTRLFRVPIGCDSLVDRSFPPHSEERLPIDASPSTTTEFSVSGGNNATPNVAARVFTSGNGSDALTVSEDYWYNPTPLVRVNFQQLPIARDA